MATILIVDDRPGNRRMLVGLLSDVGHRLLEACDGAEALQVARRERPDLIITDLLMPTIDGYELVRQLREDPRLAETTVIFHTAAYEEHEVQALAQACGVRFVLTKPAGADKILRTVEVALNGEPRSSTPPQANEFDREHLRVLTNKLSDKVDALESVNTRLARLLECGMELAAEHHPGRLCEKACRAARDIVGARYAAVGLLGPGERPALVHFAIHGETVGEGFMVEAPASDRGVLGEVLRRRRVVTSRERLGEGLGPPFLPVSESSFLAAPVQTAARAFGWLYLAGKIGADEFGVEDERLAAVLAGQLAVTYENVRLYATLQRRTEWLSQQIIRRRHAEGAVRERTRELEHANRLKDEFLAAVSHELRTPLTAILGWSSLLGSSEIPEEMSARGLKTIQRSAVLQARIVDDLLDVSKIASGKLRIERQPVELTPVIETVIEALRPAAEAKSLRLEPVLDPRPRFVLGDRDRLHQVVWNLVSNAVKFTPEGGLVQVRLEYKASRAELTIRDTGQGIQAAFLPHLFQHFRQADGSSTRKHGGLGLGLAIVHDLVEMHGGVVRAESGGEGKGATFVVDLPLAEGHEEGHDGDEAGHAEEASRDRAASKLTGIRVLVVEDDPATLEMLAVALSRFGADVTPAASAAEALRVMAAIRPDVLVSDIAMPGQDGYHLIQRVRELDVPDLRGIPAVALTAHAKLEERELALEAGYQVHVAKPVQPNDLVAVIAELAMAS
jgi:signal transduction histidine kinase/CheY-like chemotaxis protein